MIPILFYWFFISVAKVENPDKDEKQQKRMEAKVETEEKSKLEIHTEPVWIPVSETEAEAAYIIKAATNHSGPFPHHMPQTPPPPPPRHMHSH